MSIEQLDIVDVVSVDPNTGHVVLTISDHLDWVDSRSHQQALQAKFNRYLAFVEGGEILTRYPDAKDKPVSFTVVFKYAPDAEGWEFLSRAKQVIASAGFTLRHAIFPNGVEN